MEVQVSPSKRFVPEENNVFVPDNYSHVNNFYFGDCWYSNEVESFVVPVFKNNRFVIRYWLRPELGKTIDQTWTKEQQKRIKDALKEIEMATCIVFVELPLGVIRKCGMKIKYRIQYRKHPVNDPDQGCYTDTGGRKEFSSTTVTLADNCITADIIHETMHALGFIHEHQRPDRDDYVIVDRKVANTENFRKYPKEAKFGLKYWKTTPAFNYDYTSLMHYDFSDQLRPKKHNAKGRRKRLSVGDKQKLTFYYGCHRFLELHYGLQNYSWLYHYDYGYKRSGYRPWSGPGAYWDHPPTDVPEKIVFEAC